MILVRAYHKYFYVLRQICNVSWFIKFNSSSICMIEQLAILGTFFFKYTQTVEIIKLSYLWFLLCQFSVPSDLAELLLQLCHQMVVMMNFIPLHVRLCLENP